MGIAAVLAACGGAESDATGAASPAAPPVVAEPRFLFVDATDESGLGGFRQVSGDAEKLSIVASMGGGVALFDHDGDGVLDAYLTNGATFAGGRVAPGPPDALFRGRGDGTFEDVSAAAGVGDRGWTMGVFAADHDGDGDSDLFLTSYGPNVLLRNEGGRFVDATEGSGLGDPRWSTGAVFLDADRDGVLDLYVANYCEYDPARPPAGVHEYRGVRVYLGPRGLPGQADAFLRGRGDGTYEDATRAAGIEGADGYGFQVVAFDADDDGVLDVYVGNDSTPNHLWRNDGRGRFRDVGLEAGVALSHGGVEQAGMGVAVGDADGDGRLDLFVTNFSEDYFTLYLNDGRGLFRDATLSAGLALPTLPSLGWGCGFLDLDLDGDLDLFTANGHVYPQVDLFDLGTRYLQRPHLFENAGGGRFRDASAAAGPGFAVPRASRGAAWGDVDGDGDLDLLLGNLDGPPTLLRNETERRGRSLRVRLAGDGRNPEARGAVVRLEAGGRRSVRAVGCGSGFLSTSELALTFGLPPAESGEEPPRLVVRWPSGLAEAFEDLPAEGSVEVVEGAGARLEE